MRFSKYAGLDVFLAKDDITSTCMDKTQDSYAWAYAQLYFSCSAFSSFFQKERIGVLLFLWWWLCTNIPLEQEEKDVTGE